jgi:argininosuccinate lyase
MKERQTEQVWGERMESEPSMMNVYYCAGRDPFSRPPADELLIPYDIWLNKVHCLMLYNQKVIDIKTARAILTALNEIAKKYRNGEFKIDKEKEDVHISIEAKVAELAGEETAAHLHTGRSRNDQTTTDCRLYIRDRLLELYSRILKLCETLLETSLKHFETVMPGFTHYQPAAVTTFGHFLLSHAQALRRDLTRLGMTHEQWNSSPLGAAAGFSTSWLLDREFAARLLGFTAVQENSLDCITSRWEYEAQVALNTSLFMNHLSILAQDLIILSMPASGGHPMIEIDDAYVTGSSIMPQKRNPDFAEVTRARAAFCHGYTMSLLSLSKGALSGYNRDSQWTKYAVMDLFEEVRYAPVIFTEVISTLKVNKDVMRARCSEEFINAVDIADYIAQEKGIPFRSAYKVVSEAIRESAAGGENGNKKTAPCELNLNILNSLLRKVGKKNPKLRKSEWAMLARPERLIARRKNIGSPSPEFARKNYQNLKNNLKVKYNWYVHKQKQRESVLRLLQEEIGKVMEKK